MNYYAIFNEKGERVTSFIPGVNCDVQPDETVEITEEEQSLYCTGQYIRDSQTGHPVKRPLHIPSIEECLVQIRYERDRRFSQTMWIFQRQQTGSADQKLSDEQYQRWLDYWSALRDFPDTCDPKHPEWPVEPT